MSMRQMRTLAQRSRITGHQGWKCEAIKIERMIECWPSRCEAIHRRQQVQTQKNSRYQHCCWEPMVAQGKTIGSSSSTSLMEGAEAYWEAMRWSDLSAAAGYYQDPRVRVEWLTDMGTGGAPQYRSATILRIELGPELEDHERGWQREALALVQVQSYTMPAQVLVQQVLQQQWYLLGKTWFPAPDPKYRDW